METILSPRRGRKINPRSALIFMVLLLVLLIGAAVGISHYILTAEFAGMQNSLEQRLTARARDRAARLTVWFGDVKRQAEQFAGSDLLRLFAAEAQEKGLLAAHILRQESGSNPEDVGDSLGELAARALYIRRYLDDFVRTGGFQAVRLADPQGRVYLSSQDASAPDPEQLSVALRAVAAQRIEVSSVRRQGDGLFMDMALPVFAPLYVDETGHRLVGVLTVTRDITVMLNSLTESGEGKSRTEAGHLLETVDGVLQTLPGDGQPSATLSGWTLDAAGGLPFAERRFPSKDGGGRAVFALGIAVADLPWIVEEDVSTEEFLSRYVAFRTTVVFSAVTASLSGALVLVMLWWVLLGRRDRDVAQELGRLYETVNRQKQIIDGVNTTLLEGIVLNDLNGNILYANLAFARMTGETVEALYGKTWNTLTSPRIGENLHRHALAVQRATVPQKFTEKLEIQGEDRCCEISCVPFHAADGVMTGVVSVYRDVTEEQLVQEKHRRMVARTIKAFSNAVEAVDPYLLGHSRFTGRLAPMLAQRLGLPEHMATLETAAHLSQIGMIRLPHSLLTKTGLLTPEERAQLQRHVEYADEALDGIDFGLPVQHVIRGMYERLDGSGYPLGLQGEAIGPEARILAAANTFCALLRPRSYRTACTLEEAMSILAAPAYDRQVVHALADYLNSPEGRSFVEELQGTGR